ncbi:MAG: L,D-transpeptidase family protein [Eggerthellaceae bacterium]
MTDKDNAKDKDATVEAKEKQSAAQATASSQEPTKQSSPVPASKPAPQPTAKIPPVPPVQTTGAFRPVVPVGTPRAEATAGAHGIVVEGKRPGKIALITLGIILGVLLLVYVGVSLFFFNRFWPNTALADLDISTMNASDTQALISDAVNDYSLEVKGEGLSFTLTAADAGISLDSTALVAKMLEDVNPWMWPVELTKHHDASNELVLSSAQAGLKEVIGAQVEAFNANAKAPQNATIAYTEAVKAFTVVPEVAGTAFSADEVLKVVDGAIAKMDRSVSLTKQQLAQPTVTEKTPELTTACASANKMIAAQMRFLMAGTLVSELGSAQIAPYVRLQEDLSVVLDDGFLTEWSDKTAAACNTYGSTRTYTRPDGKVCTVSGGVVGWVVDNAALKAVAAQGVAEGKQGDMDVPVTQSATAFNGAGAQDWGPRYVDVDLSEQTARFYDGAGALIWSAAFVSGVPDGKKNTPTGVYVVNAMQSPSTLIGSMMPNTGKPEYETKVQYWMPFVGNAVGFHDANWQSSFGGTRYADGYGSHGCINLSVGDAGALYSLLAVGDVVVSHN